MNNDSSREKLDFALYCAKHPEQRLTFNTTASKIGASSAYEINIKVAVHPCAICERQMENIVNAVSFLTSLKNKSE